LVAQGLSLGSPLRECSRLKRFSGTLYNPRLSPVP
jgi:hypothetical protein